LSDAAGGTCSGIDELQPSTGNRSGTRRSRPYPPDPRHAVSLRTVPA